MAHVLNRPFFFDEVRRTLFDGRLSKPQVSGMDEILDQWESLHAGNDDRWLAYSLGTAHHETGRAMQPVRELGRGRNLPYGKPDAVTGQTYYGRGLVQITWKTNYRALGAAIGEDLVYDPDRALELDVAVRILFCGMIDGRFTGKRLADYFNPARDDWRNARRVVNSLDRADLVAGYGRRYYAALSYRAADAA